MSLKISELSRYQWRFAFKKAEDGNVDVLAEALRSDLPITPEVRELLAAYVSDRRRITRPRGRPKGANEKRDWALREMFAVMTTDLGPGMHGIDEDAAIDMLAHLTPSPRFPKLSARQIRKIVKRP